MVCRKGSHGCHLSHGVVGTYMSCSLCWRRGSKLRNFRYNVVRFSRRSDDPHVHVRSFFVAHRHLSQDNHIPFSLTSSSTRAPRESSTRAGHEVKQKTGHPLAGGGSKSGGPGPTFLPTTLKTSRRKRYRKATTASWNEIPRPIGHETASLAV